MAKLMLNQCKCGKTYNLKQENSTDELCSTCNEKILKEKRKKDSLRKLNSRDDRLSSNLEKLGDIEK